MKPIFFFYKMREVKSFLKIMSGKLTGNNERRIKGIDEALSNMKDEQKVYLDERKKAQRDQEQENRDVSAI